MSCVVRMQGALYAEAFLGCLLLWSGLTAGCGGHPPPSEVLFFAWSDGERLTQLEAHAKAFNLAQQSSRVTVKRWPEAARGKQSAAALLEALDNAGATPALLEVPDAALAGFVEAERARDVGGQFAKRLGVRFDDYLGGLLPAERVASEGVCGLPLFHEAPLLAFSDKAGLTGDGAEIFASLAKLADPGPRAEPSEPGAQPSEPGVSKSERQPEADPDDPELRPLSVSADFRLFLATLRLQGAKLVTDDLAPLPADRQALKQGFEEALALAGGKTFSQGSLGEDQAIAAFEKGGFVALWVWSGAAHKLTSTDLRFVRVPAATRGTYLVVNSRADWRIRQAAFRFSRWITEPQQTTALTEALGTIPVRQSSINGATAKRLARQTSYREAAWLPHEPLVVPGVGRFAQSLLETVEPALAAGAPSAKVVEELQHSLATADESN